MPFTYTDTCRACGNAPLTVLHDFGETPLADRLVRPGSDPATEPKAPLVLTLCEHCSLVQINASVDPNILFGGDYLYYSSVSPSLMRHFEMSAQNTIQTENLNQESFVFEIASNDGYMLKTFKNAGIRVLGVDPASGPAKAAMDAGIPTLNTFFAADLAMQIANEHGKADVVLANNVLAHVPDLNGVVEGIAIVLKDDGVAVIECPYLFDLVDHGEFDTIYHQHLCYFSVTALTKLFGSHGLVLNDVKRTSVHGGSLRLFVRKAGANMSENVHDMLAAEENRKVTLKDAYSAFINRVSRLQQTLAPMIRELRAGGASVAAYGAAAKATTLLAYCGLRPNELDFIADLNQQKHGWLMPGAEFPIVAASHVAEAQPDYLLILAWNFAEEIMAQQASYAEAGGKFIVPIPELQII